MTPAAFDRLVFGGVLLVAFVVGGLVFGSVAEILNVCTTSRCVPVERYVVPNVGAGLAVAAVTTVVLLLYGQRSSPPVERGACRPAPESLRARVSDVVRNVPRSIGKLGHRGVRGAARDT